MKNMLAKFIMRCSSDMMLESEANTLELVETGRLVKYCRTKDVEYVILKLDESLMSYKNKLMSFTVIMWEGSNDREVMEAFKCIRSVVDQLMSQNLSETETINKLDEFIEMYYPQASLSFGE